MKRFFSLILSLCVLFAVCAAMASGLTASAEEEKAPANDNYIFDQADLLSADEERQLQAEAQHARDQYGYVMVIVTTNSLDGKTLYDYAEDFFVDNFGAGNELNGIMLLVSMEDRDYDIVTRGEAEGVFTDSRISSIEDEFLSDLSDGRYYAAFHSFFVEAQEKIADELKGPNYVGITIGALAIGFLLSMIPMASLKAQVKNVKMQSNASTYVRNNSLRLDSSRDVYLYASVQTRHIERTQSSGSSSGYTHTHSSGTTFTHHSGKF